MERWSFNLQIYFLNSRFRQVMQIRESGKKSFKTEPFMKMHIFLFLIFTQWVWWLIEIFKTTLHFWIDGVNGKSTWFINLFKKLYS
jgi:deoxyadenosine/deoxycytidine kinase